MNQNEYHQKHLEVLAQIAHQIDGVSTTIFLMTVAVMGILLYKGII